MKRVLAAVLVLTATMIGQASSARTGSLEHLIRCSADLQVRRVGSPEGLHYAGSENLAATRRAPARYQTPTRPTRIVSLVPAVTEMIFAIGEGARVAAVSNYDHFPADVAGLPRVGGLHDPSVERILAIKPDLVIVYATQKELIARLDRAGIAYFNYQHKALPDILTTIRAIGGRIGAAARAESVASEMERSLADVRRQTGALPHPATLLVFERDPAGLRNVFASGGYGFLHDMLEIAGGRNVFAAIEQQAVQASTEMLIASRPDVIIELLYGDHLEKADVAKQLRAWDALPSVPAVRAHRIVALTGDEFVVPGPRIVDATLKLARVLHPDVFK